MQFKMTKKHLEFVKFIYILAPSRPFSSFQITR